MLSLFVISLLAIDGGAKLPDAGVVVVVAPGPCKQTQELCFSPDGQCDARVVALIDRTKPSGTLDILIYSINRAVIVDSILRAKARGAVVRVIVDSSQIGDPKEQPQLQRLLAAGIPLKRDTHQGIMHMKVVIRENIEFSTGSFNFTNNASENNDENLLIWDCPRNAALYTQRFNLLWAKFKDARESVLKTADAGR